MAHPSQAINSRAILGDANSAIAATSAGVEHFFAIQNLHSAATTLTIAGNYLQDDATAAQTSGTIPSGVTFYGDFTSVTPAAAEPLLLYY